jgi:lanosterol synthase
MLLASRDLVTRGIASGRWDHVKSVSSDLAERSRWLLGGALHLTPPTPTQPPNDRAAGDSSAASLSAEERFGAALKASSVKADVVELPSAPPSRSGTIERNTIAEALDRGTRAFMALQADDGSWEGEVVWSPMLAAQYVIASHILERPIDPLRKKRFLLHFERTRNETGAWGLHELSHSYLFTTTLVYVAARLLGVAKNDPLLSRALRFIRDEGGVEAIPSWGKFWLALLNLYAWEGVSPVLPEIWNLPKWFPLHPSHYYCHTRLIYLGMATLAGQRFQVQPTALTDELRGELFPGGYASVDFERARTSLREGDLLKPWTKPLDLAYRALRFVDRRTTRAGRDKALKEVRDRIRTELRTTRFTSISPVSGILDLLALGVADPRDPDVESAFRAMDGFIWEDDVDGARIAGARSACWDTAFATQALACAAPHVEVGRALERAGRYLEAQQIHESLVGAEAVDRVDPRGGYCFAGGWHGWPVSDCTAEALVARIQAGVALGPSSDPDPADLEEGIRFLLQEQNSDGGFSTYEPRRIPFSIEWLNPAEMFGDSMTEYSFVESTAASISAMVAARSLLRSPELVDEPIRRATQYLVYRQHPNGSWPAAMGVRLVYGTMFGIRGLVAGGVPCTDPAMRKACAWLKARQRPDGSWGEQHLYGSVDEYAEEGEGQVIQTAWALSALLDAADPDWDAIERAARFIASSQLGSGEWPKQAPAGVFFHTALLDYSLYRAYFPLKALAEFETRRKLRAALYDVQGARGPAHRSDVLVAKDHSAAE